MVRKREYIAMLLAGGQGSRLGVLTDKRAKPVVPFGGKYRIIDFTLSNCINSGIDTVGILTQYQPLELHEYIGNGQAWDLDRMDGGVQILPPYQKRYGTDWYKGTANAVYQNMDFIDRYEPEYVIVLSGDHVYKMDYCKMLAYHKEKKADCTISVIDVPSDQISQFGILYTNEDGSVREFIEKPMKSKSTLASMGIYIFTWKKLKQYLEADERKKGSSNDFGKDLIPDIIKAGERVFSYPYSGYWRDVGTIDSLWKANMDLLRGDSKSCLNDNPEWRVFTKSSIEPPCYISKSAKLTNSIVAEGCQIYGEVSSSILFHGVTIDKGAVIRNSILMPNVHIKERAHIGNAIIADDVVIGEDATVGCFPDDSIRLGSGITVVGDGVEVGCQITILADLILDKDLQQMKVI